MKFSTPKKVSHGINMVPLINIVFLLLIFFMLSTTLVAPEKIPVEAPQSKNSQEQKEHQFSLTIVESGDIFYEGSKTSLVEISQALQTGSLTNSEIELLIKADSNARTKTVLSVLEVARVAGVGKVSLATQHPLP
tara:strand:+ start:108 stop:512 length:405 start_codon:yes stop_codon:yes gene_type:complete